MHSGIQTLPPSEWVHTGLARLQEMPQPPKTLYYQGTLPKNELPLLSVVGSRKYTTYGKQVVKALISGLQSYEVGIVSGLALGIDALAHQAALDAHLYTMAIPGSGLNQNVLYPAQNRRLAQQIISTGGGLVSEFSPKTKAARWTFPQRNRLMAAVSQATLLVEAQERSGTLITARMCVDYDRELLVVPGSIFSPNSIGVHQFLKLGATPITNSDDIVDVLSLSKKSDLQARYNQLTDVQLSKDEQRVLDCIREPIDIDTIARRTGISITDVHVILMQLEINAHIDIVNGLYHRRI